MADEVKLRRYLEKVTVDLRKARQRAQNVEDRAYEPIAIVGMACRYPGGVASPVDLWRVVAEERDAITEFPTDRGWDLERLYDPDPDNLDTSYVREGGFLADAADFDASFFAISPREALTTDPQERLLLESSWEALGDAGIDPTSLAKSLTGVFAGVGYQDYGLAPGMGSSIVSGRVAYTLGLEGPAISIDTACSSSLVAIHLASQALRGGECNLVLAGGVTVLSSPMSFIGLSRQRGLSPDGRSKSFAEAADGTGWSEGVGMLVLERLSDAQRAGHEVLALIKGSAVNQDGASNGLTAPNGPSQERVIRQALANARLEPKDVDVVEGHGTGTTLGDPIEAGALLATYGQDREEPLRLGSIKSNIGHTQAAAGVAGTIKMVEAMRRRVLPKTLHVDAPSSKVEWASGQIELLTEQLPWEPNGAPRRAGVSSFGVSGTNAHVILEEAPDLEPLPGESGEVEGGEAPAAQPLGTLIPLALSAKTEPALAEMAERLAAQLKDNPGLDPTDVAFSLTTTRSTFEHRAVALGADREELLTSLGALADGKESQSIARGRARTEQRPIFLFPGQGAQAVGMSTGLLDASAPFDRHISECEEALAPHVDWSLREVLREEQGEWLTRLDIVQPALFAVMVSLTRLWRECGVEPAALIGHSQGEIAAAHIAGALTLEDAALIIAKRAQAMAKIAGKGGMLSVSLRAEELPSHTEPYGERVSLAAINGPASLVLSGDPEALAELERGFEAEGVRAKPIAVDYAAHSAQIEELKDELEEAFAPISPKATEIPLISTVTAEQIEGEQLGPEYWYRNLRKTVLLEPVIRAQLEAGRRALIEIGPHPVLAFGVEETFEEVLTDPTEATLLFTLKREEDEPRRFALSLAEAHAQGIEVEWQAFFKGTSAKRVPLPTYPFQRKRYWLTSGQGATDASAIGQSGVEHPLLSAAIEDPDGEGLTLTGRISLATHPWLADHAVGENVLLPGTAFLELALKAAEELGAQTVAELTLAAPLLLPEQGAVAIQVSVSGPDEQGNREIAVHSRPDEEDAQWTRHASGSLSEEPAPTPEPLGEWPPTGAEPLELDYLYDVLAEMGLRYGPAFQGLTAAWKAGDEIYVEASLPEEQASQAQSFAIHPALLDAALHGIALAGGGGDMQTMLPFSWSGVALHAEGPKELRAQLDSGPAGGFSLLLADAAGAPVGTVGEVVTRPVDPAQLQRHVSPAAGLLGLEWSEVDCDRPVADGPGAEIIRLGAEPGDEGPEAARAAVKAALAHVQRRLGDDSEAAGSRLAIVTQCALAVGAEEPGNPASAAIWGLLRSAISEHPGCFALIDTDGSGASEAALPAALEFGAEEPELVLRAGRLLAPRLSRLELDEAEVPFSLDPERTVLITGATGGLGSLLARHLAERHGARHLLLLSRSGPDAEGAEDLAVDLEALGAMAQVVACDVADREALEKILLRVSAEHPLGTVIHCAGALADATIENLGAEQIDRVFTPKIDGAWHLHELTRESDLGAFVLYSSAAGILGGPGQGNYAAANVFLDALAQKRRAEGLAANSIAWGLWERESDMTSQLDGVDMERIGRGPVEALSDEQGMVLFDAALGASNPVSVALALNSGGLRALASAGALPPLLSGLVRAPRRRGPSGSLVAKLAALPEAEREGHVLNLVRREVAATLGHPSSDSIEPLRAFQELGFDSLAAVELRNRLGVATGLRLAATVVFDYPNAAALAAHLLAEASASGPARPVAVRATASEEPIAIVGMACRYPGAASSPAELWRLVSEGADGITEFPADRGWDTERLYDPDPDNPGTSYAHEGGFLAEVADFDADFFSISPREALVTDPQQRLLLESSWEALESAGIDPALLRESPTGVFAGVMYQDYGPGAGGTQSIVSGRVAYALGLEGPAISIDTACSSSLVAMHLASQALRGGECNLALAGGVSVLTTLDVFVGFSAQRGLAPDGRCKPYAEAADGTGFSEGVGILVLERLSDARRAGHEVLALLKGSAVNQDGASNGLTAPNGPSQERVIRQALANARLEPKDVDVVEGHGTGTTLGDPIEAGALLATYGQDREEPLRLGSIKSNIGHTQAAAGVAGTIKMVEAMRRRVLPKTLHVDAPSSKVEWASGQIELLTEQLPWEPNGAPRRAGVSSFGVSGTNAHVILEEAPDLEPLPGESGEVEGGEAPAAQPLGTLIPLALSAKTEPALAEMAERLAAQLKDNPGLDPTDVAFSLTTTRSTFEHRAVALGADREELLTSLGALADGKESQSIARGRARTEQRPIFIFPGQGSQWEGMALDLIAASPVFAAKLAECEQALVPHVGWSVTDVLRQSEGAPSLDRVEVVQPALFAVIASLAALWRACGVHPAAVVGHSQGEIVAAHVAGGLSLEDAAMLVALRSRIISKLSGRMASVALGPEELEPLLEPWGQRIEVAAHNGPSSTILSGEQEAIEAMLAHCEREEIRAREISPSIASHSAHVEEVREEVLDTLAPLSPQSGEIPFHSTVTGGLLDTAELDASYWYRNLRETVRFEEVTRNLIERGGPPFIEVSPHPVFALAVGETIEAALGEGAEASVIGTLRREEDGPRRFALSLAEAHAQGIEVEWGAFFKGTSPKRVALPTYPFQRERYWLASSQGTADASAIGQNATGHPLLSAAIEDPDGEGLTLTGRISLATHPWLADHAVGGTVLLSAAVLLEIALKAAAEADAEGIEELTMLAPLILAEDGAVALQVAVSRAGEDRRRELSIHSRSVDGDGEWIQNAGGFLAERLTAAPSRLDDWPPPGAEPLDVDYLYDQLTELGVKHGAAFDSLTAAWREGERVYAQTSLSEQMADEADRFGIHPVLLDAALLAAMLTTMEQGERAPNLPFAWRGVRLAALGATELRARLVLGEDAFELQLFDAEGAPVASVGSLNLRRLDASQVPTQRRSGGGLLAVDWHEIPLGEEEEEEVLPSDVEVLRCQTDPDLSVADAARKASRDALESVQQWLTDESKTDGCLALVTRGAVAAMPGESPNPAAAAIWGLVRSAQAEHPGRFALIDVDGSETSEAALDASLALAVEESQLALRDGSLLAPRLGKLAGIDLDEDSARIDPERTVAITGATDAASALVAGHLVERYGALRLLLLAGDAAEKRALGQLIEELESAGAAVEVAVCDLANRESLRAALDTIDTAHPLGAVIHCATLLDDSLVESMSGEQIDLVFAPKVEVAWNLHELTVDRDLSAFVLFSSVIGALPSPGHGSYAAANAFLDALAQGLRVDGRSASSIAWGLWEHQAGGEGGVRETDVERMGRGGIKPFADEDGLALFDEALAVDRAGVLAARLDTAGLRALATAGTLPPLFSNLVRVPVRRAAAGSFAAELATLSGAERENQVLDLVRSEVAVVLGHASTQAVDPDRTFRDLGFESLTAVELRNRLSEKTGLRLPTTVVFDHPTTISLAEYILTDLGPSGARLQTTVRAQASEEPIAIVGMACRYPGGVASPEELWRLVAEGRDSITEFPTDRGWDLDGVYDPDPAHLGTSYVCEGGFLDEAAEFDAGFFGISPREAIVMDPQERLLLESSWEALEDARIDPLSLRKSLTGVFAGVAYQDYGPTPIVSSSIVSGRIAYTLGLEGPAITVNTACSSSLVAMHLASQALRGGECTLALAGGVTILSTPSVFVQFSHQRGVAPDGRCKAFSDAADGTGFSDGVGMVILERLVDAERAGHPVYAIVRGSAVNQDGASNGLAAPNGPSQERVIRQALANARLHASDVEVVEAHGTGTTLGDPIEAGALLATYGQDREAPLKLGSLKSNIGHTQAAAGVGGVIKMALAMRERILPKTLHVGAPSTKVDWEAGQIELLTEEIEWEANGAPRRAGVSSFGASGTNAHLILEEPVVVGRTELSAGGETSDVEEAPAMPLSSLIPLVLSAKTEPALAAASGRLARHLRANPELEPRDVAYSLASTRAALERRAVVLGTDRAALLASLDALAEDRPAPGLARGETRRAHRPVFLFPGQGAQAKEMATGLIESSPAFAGHISACEEALSEHVEWSLAEVLGDADAAWLERLDVVQPALFAVMVSLARLWRECGVTPAAVVGHSQGEIAAAHVAGALSLADASLIVAERGKAMAKLAGKGGMLAVSLPVEGLPRYTDGLGDRISLAAINGPASLVLSGDPEALAAVEADCGRDGVATRAIAVDYAAHSAQIDVLEDELLEVFAPIVPRSADIPIHSTVTGEEIDAKDMGPRYWYRNLRQTVRLEPVLRSLLRAGRRAFVEVGPHPVLAFGVAETVEDELESPADALLLSTLRRDEDDAGCFARSLAEAQVNGVTVDWEAFFDGSGVRRVSLPTYPFQRERYWLDAGLATAFAPVEADETSMAHPLVDSTVDLAGGDGGRLVLSGTLSPQAQSWLARRAVAGQVLVPGGVFLELAWQTCVSCGAGAVAELVLHEPLILAEHGVVALQARLEEPDGEGRRSLSIYSRDEEEGAGWVRRASGVLSAEALTVPESLAAWPPEGDCVHAEVFLPEDEAHDAERFALHPGLLEFALEGAGLGEQDSGEVELPREWRQVALHAEGASSLRLVLDSDEGVRSLIAYDLDGNPVLSATSLESARLDRGKVESARRRRSLFSVRWQPISLEGAGDVAGETVEIVAAEVDAGELAAAAQATAEQALGHLQRWIADEERGGERLTLITRGAIAAAGDEQPDLAAAAVWGLLRSAIAENPGRFALVDSDGSEASEKAMRAALARGADEPQIALRAGEALVPRVIPVQVEASDGPILSLDLDSTVLIAGDVDGRGKAVADHLAAAHGVAYFRYARPADLADPATLEWLVDSVPAEHPLRTVVYVPVDDDALQARIEAAWRLHELTAEVDGSRLLAFSSAAGLLGGTGQASVAACGAFLDALAFYRQGLGLSGASLSWGPWAGDGDEVPRDAAVPLPDDDALDLFDAARELDLPLLAPIRFSSARLRGMGEAGVLPAALRELTSVRPRRRPEAFAGRLAALAVEEREAAILDLLRAQIAEILGYSSAAAVDPTRPLLELGLDSVGAMELRNRVAAMVGAQVPVSVLADQPTVQELARHVGEALDSSAPTAPDDGQSTGTFGGLLDRAREQGEIDAFMDLLTGAAKYRPSFDRPLAVGDSPAPVSLADGKVSPGLVLVSSLVAMSGPQEYVRLAQGLRGRRSAIGLRLPGFAAGEPLPADLDAFARSTAEAIQRDWGDSSFALAGYSSGGWAAHAVAASLERLGTPAAAVILLDTPSTSVHTAKLLELMPTARGDRGEQLFVPPDDARLTAMAHYFQLFGEWEPEELGAPVLMVRAKEPLEVVEEQIDEMAEILPPLETVRTPGNHLTMMWEHADDTARAMHELLASLAKSPTKGK